MRHPLVPVALVLALLILVAEGLTGCFTRWADPMRSPSHYGHYVDGECFMRVRVADLPEQRPNSYRTLCQVLDVADSNGTVHACQGKLLLYLATPYNVGDELLLLAHPRRPDSADNPHQFDYRRHLQRRGICFIDYLPDSRCRLIGHAKGGLRQRVVQLRQRIIQVIHFSRLTPAQQGIAEALILGWDGDLDADTRAHFQTAGIVHLLCVSGLHVGIVALLAGWLLSLLGRRLRLVRGMLQLSAVWGFVLLAGMAPSASRAAIMCSFVIVGNLLQRQPTSLNSIAASAVVMLAVKPLLLFEPGFQLSYAAVIGIVTMLPAVANLLPIPKGKTPLGNMLSWCGCKLRDLLILSIVAQLCTTPFALYYFHRFPTYFLIANLTVIPFATVLLGSVMLLIVFAWWPWLFGIIGRVVSAELGATEWITARIAALPHAVIDGIYFDRTLLFLGLGLAAAIGWLLSARRRWPPVTAALALMLAMAIHLRVVEGRCAAQQHLDVYHVGRRTAIEYFVGHRSYLIADSATAKHPESIGYQTENNCIYRQIRQRTVLPLDTTYSDAHLMLSNHFISLGDKTMRIIDRTNYREHSRAHIQLDYLLLCQSPSVTLPELCQQYRFDTLIIASDNAPWRARQWQSQADRLAIPYRQ